jgi:membrane-associated protease RseP (regulator of RpoE activity)
MAGSTLTISGISDTSALGSIGLQVGDRIMAVNGHPAGSGMSLLNELSRLAGSNQSASLTVMNSTGTRQVLNVPGSALQSIMQARAAIGSGRGPGGNAAQQNNVGQNNVGQNNVGQNMVSQILGVTFADTGNGLVISSIAANSPLQNLGLQPGDQITSLNGQPISSPAALLSQLAAAAPSQVRSIGASLGILRNGAQISTTVPASTLLAIARADAQFGAGRGTFATQNTNGIANSAAAQTTISGDQQAAVNAVTGFNPATTALKPAIAATALPNATTLPNASTVSNATTLPSATAGVTNATTTQGVTPGLGTTTAQSAGGQAVAAGQPAGVGQGTATAPGQAQGAAALSAQSGAGTPVGGAAGAARGSGWAKFNDAEYRALGLPVPPGTPTVPMSIPGPNTTSTTDTTSNQTAGANATAGAAAGVQPAGAQSPLPTTVITPNGPRIAVPGQAQGQARGAAGGVPGVMGPAGKAAPGAAKAGGNAGGKAAGGAARGGGGGARNTGGGGGGAAKGGAS